MKDKKHKFMSITITTQKKIKIIKLISNTHNGSRD